MKKYLYLLILTTLIFTGCDKMKEKSPAPTTEQSPHGTDKQMDAQTQSGKDDNVDTYKKSVDDAEAKFTKDNSDANKKEVIEKNLAAGNYMMFEANVPPKEKYRPALKYFRRVIELDADNKDARANKDRIEEIYTQMGLPIPQ